MPKNKHQYAPKAVQESIVTLVDNIRGQATKAKAYVVLDTYDQDTIPKLETINQSIDELVDQLKHLEVLKKHKG